MPEIQGIFEKSTGISFNNVFDRSVSAMLRNWSLRNLPPRKYYTRRNNKVDSIETECVVIDDLFPWSDLEKWMCHHAFLINEAKILSSLLNL